MKTRVGACLWVAVSMLGAGRVACAPILYAQPEYESPTRGEPGDLLFLAGYGLSADDRVVYRAQAGAPPQHPGIPTGSSEMIGIAEVVNTSAVPYGLTVRLPDELKVARSYELWAVSRDNEWSPAVHLNDARPLWFSPAAVYSSARLASLPRYLKVIGRNLDPPARSKTRVKLSGPREFMLDAEPAASDDEVLGRYVIKVALPSLPVGEYGIQIARGDDGWVKVAGSLQVKVDPSSERRFAVSNPDYGGCRPDDGQDASECVRHAIQDARLHGGGSVYFDAGSWHLSERSLHGTAGIEVPSGVNLLGAGPLNTTIIKDADESDSTATSWFTLLGHNRVEQLGFKDARRYGEKYVNSAVLRLGYLPGLEHPSAPLEDIIISHDRFERPFVGIADSGVAIARLSVTYNEFLAFRSALELAGSRYLVNQRFNVQDSVIVFNVFKPGSYLALQERQGTMASELGASKRVDFSQNTADGASTEGLYSSEDAHGWRAAFFFHMNNSHEMLLVAQNVASCTGDKVGDGEAISFDNNANTFGLPAAAAVFSATAAQVTLLGRLARRQNDRDIALEDYYRGHWLQVGAGPGVGQVRRISAYHEDADRGRISFEVTPAWDVIPVAGESRLNVGREYWQAYVLGNVIDHRRPLCAKSNRSDPKGGGISIWGQNADSVVAGNRQYDTDGITLQQYYSAEEPGCPACIRGTNYVDFLEIRDNLIEGEYDGSDDCSSSGIFGSMAAAPTHSAPTTVSFGLAIAHNRIEHADGLGGGGISLMPTWFQGPAPHRWPLVDNVLLYRNTLRGFDASPARGCKGAKPHERTAISFGQSALSQHAVLYANSCPGARRAIDLRGVDATLLCRADDRQACGCAAVEPPQ